MSEKGTRETPESKKARKELLDQPNDLETICHLCKANGYYTP